MLKIIRRVLRLSGNLSKRIWGSFFCGFLESMFGLLPIVAVFFVLNQLQWPVLWLSAFVLAQTAERRMIPRLLTFRRQQMQNR